MKKSKVYSAVLSFVIAFGLWLYVVSNVSEVTDNTFYDIPVVMEGEAVLSEQNLMITNVSAKAVSLHLSGARSDLNKLDNKNMTVKVNLATIDGPGEKIPLYYTPSYPSDVSSSAFTEESRSPEVIYVDVDYRRNFEIPVQVKWTGTRSEDYIYDTENATLDYPKINIIGPAAVADLIECAVVEIDLTDETESISGSYRYTLCDAEGNAVDAERITTNVEEVRVEMQIQRIKQVKLEADIVYGGGANESNTDIEINPEVIRVSGSEAVLAEVGDVYSIGSIILADQEKPSGDLNYNIVLPEGVTNQTGINEVTVTFRITGSATKEFVIEKFETISVPEGMEAEVINASLTVKVRGPAAEVAKLTEEDIKAVVDFSNAEVGTATYKAAIVFGENFPNVGALKTSTVSATVQAKE